ncbi:MAG TPA: mannose-1-phosphate guanylyltransferase [Myxococcaceae bacterium]|nr:mannose-1-phosphate guanylyltransferase [Myxococcaceae bacterium]
MNDLHPVIIAGGSGTRFWPLSRTRRPKQFLPLASNKPLIADTVARLKGLAPLARTLVVCGKLHARAVRAAVPGLPAKNVLVEPAARNTAPAIGLATIAVASRDPEGVLLVLPSDHHVGDPKRFREVLAHAAEVARTGMLVTIGLSPTRPETGYGYVQVGEPLSGAAKRVRRFVEKPDSATARQYVDSGEYLWNGGIFVFQARTMLDAIREHLPALADGLEVIRKSRSKLAKVFPTLPAISIDYAVMEKAKNIAVLPGDFGWSDVGSFTAMEEVRPLDQRGNVAAGKLPLLVDCDGCVVMGKERPLAVVGMKDVVVVDAGDAVLVVPKARSQDVRQVVEALKQRKLSRYL